MANRIDPRPRLSGSTKEAFRISETTTLRKREPTNEYTGSKTPAMTWDHSNQMRIWPDQKKSALIEHTQQTLPGDKDYRTINRSGHPYALGVDIGGAPDTRGQINRLYDAAPRRKLTDKPSNGRGMGPKLPNGRRRGN